MLFVELNISGTIKRLSLAGYAGQYWWAPAILGPPSFSWGHGDEGGYIKPSVGEIRFAPSVFNGVPPAKCDITLSWGMSDSALTLIYEGICLHRQTSKVGVEYKIWQPDYSVEALATATHRHPG